MGVISSCYQSMHVRLSTAMAHCGSPDVCEELAHNDVIKWKHFPRNWPFVRGIHRPPVNSPRKGQ